MRKKFILSLVLVGMIMSTTMGVCKAQDNEKLNTMKETIKIATVEKYGDAKMESGLNEYSSVFQEELTEFADDSYEYLFNTNGEIKSMSLISKSGQSLLGSINSKDEAEYYAIDLVEKVAPNFFSLDYDTVVNKIDYDGENLYNVELWEKVSEKFYTGNKISVVLTSDGYIDTFVTRDNEVTEEMYNEVGEEVSKDQAVDLAYDQAEKMATTIEDKYNNEVKEIASNAIAPRAVDTRQLDINVEDKSTQSVNTYREIKDGEVVWVVEISSVETNNEYGNVDFSVSVDSDNGKIVDSTVTR